LLEIRFTKDGAERFRKLTAAHVGRQLAIVVDGQIESVPTIQDEIASGALQFRGTFSIEEAQRLATGLENPLPTPVKVLAEHFENPAPAQTDQAVVSTNQPAADLTAEDEGRVYLKSFSRQGGVYKP
jgi:SecD/SecF fusion protein